MVSKRTSRQVLTGEQLLVPLPFWQETRLVHDETFRRLCRSREYLMDNWRLPVALERAASEACLSPFHFHRVFAGTFGETPHELLTKRRIDESKRLLASASLTVTEVCLEVGYSSLGSFSSRFRTHVGCTPTEYQREMRRVFGYSAPWRITFMPVCYLDSFGGIDY